jgi:hypothetical protein
MRKTVHWLLIAGRILAVTFGLTLVHTGCGDGAHVSGTSTEEEKQRDADTRKAMEENAAKSAPAHKKR